MGETYSDERGVFVWRIVGGKRIKIYDGQSLSEAMIASGKFPGAASRKGLKSGGKSGTMDYAGQLKELDNSKYPDNTTYDIETLKPISYGDGYQVTFSLIGDNYSDQEFTALVDEFKGYSSDGKAGAGKFENHPEVSFNVKDKQKAIDLAKKHNQISVWDWEQLEEIKTGGTGRR